MKVLVLSNKAPYPANDGSSIAIYNMLLGLLENKVEVHLLTINTKKHFKPDAAVPDDFKAATHYTSVYKNTDTRLFGAALNLLTGDSYFVSRFYFSRFKSELIKTLKHTQFDVVQIEGVFMAGYLQVIRKYSKAKVVLRAHNIEHHIWERHLTMVPKGIKHMYLSMQKQRLKKFELETIPGFDAVVPISENDTRYLSSTFHHLKSYTCITGVNIAAYKNVPESKLQAQTVFSFGSMDWMPNQEAVRWFIKYCWPDIHKQVPSSKLVVAGRAMPLDFFQMSAPNLVLEENVENAAEFYASHQIMIVPLLSGSGLRIKIIEGMAYGKAIVSTAIGAEGLAVSHNENILIANTANEFTEAVLLLLNSSDLRNRLQENAARFAEQHFDNFSVTKGLVHFYQSLINA